ncbi:MAG: hypothetical protein LBG31_06020 [Prevotellaceae bacterium]|nr:hypothetical protein [Prevotellaceae bacterium]
MDNPVRTRGDFKGHLCFSRGARTSHDVPALRRARCRAGHVVLLRQEKFTDLQIWLALLRLSQLSINH